MRERPILFAGPMVRAILSGQKTVTRRIVKPQYSEGPWSVRTAETPRHERHTHDWWLPGGTQPYAALPHCPYGQPGDRLWVRETWAHVGNTDPGYLTYRATYPECLPPGLERVPADIRDAGCRWRPSIHMPRAHSRILLEITDVRVERLQDISFQQALAEGIDSHPSGFFGNGCTTAVGAFHELWESINGAGSWGANPWVWVVEFKRITP